MQIEPGNENIVISALIKSSSFCSLILSLIILFLKSLYFGEKGFSKLSSYSGIGFRLNLRLGFIVP